MSRISDQIATINPAPAAVEAAIVRLKEWRSEDPIDHRFQTSVGDLVTASMDAQPLDDVIKPFLAEAKHELTMRAWGKFKETLRLTEQSLREYEIPAARAADADEVLSFLRRELTTLTADLHGIHSSLGDHIDVPSLVTNGTDKQIAAYRQLIELVETYDDIRRHQLLYVRSIDAELTKGAKAVFYPRGLYKENTMRGLNRGEWLPRQGREQFLLDIAADGITLVLPTVDELSSAPAYNPVQVALHGSTSDTAITPPQSVMSDGKPYHHGMAI